MTNRASKHHENADTQAVEHITSTTMPAKQEWCSTVGCELRYVRQAAKERGEINTWRKWEIDREREDALLSMISLNI